MFSIMHPLLKKLDCSDVRSKESSPTVQHDSILSQISGVLIGPVVLLVNNEHTGTVQSGTLLKNNLAAVKPAQDAASSSSDPSQPEIWRRRRYSPEFINNLKQELFTHKVRQVAEKHRLPYSTVYHWSIEPGGGREMIKRNNIRSMAKQSRFHTLTGLKKHCVDRVNDLCSQQQNLRELSKKEIIIQVAKEEGIEIQTLKSWVALDRNYSLGSRSIYLSPMKTPDNKHSVKKARPHQTVSGNSDAQQLKAHSNIHPVKFRSNKPSTAPPTVRSDLNYAEKNEKGFA